jgi:hypothetical protein
VHDAIHLEVSSAPVVWETRQGILKHAATANALRRAVESSELHARREQIKRAHEEKVAAVKENKIRRTLAAERVKRGVELSKHFVR